MFSNVDNNFLLLLLFSLIAIFIILLLYYRKSKINISLLKVYEQQVKDHKEYLERYKYIVDIDEALNMRQSELQNKESSIIHLQNEYLEKEKKLNVDYIAKRKIFDTLLYELQVLEEDLELKSFGLYKPHYDFDTSEKYIAKLYEIIEKQKNIIKEKRATICSAEWTVNGSRVEGRKQTNQYSKLMLRAFNGESDATILKVRWNNIVKMEERIRKAYEIINKMGTVHNIYLSYEYLNLKIEELRLAYEYQEKKQQEKEEARRRREELKEEEQVQKEIDDAIRLADKEEMIYQDALDKARKEISAAKETEIDGLNQKIEELQKKLTEVNQMRERAISRAQLTKSGYVYIISNIGSFGENIFKIGMTRRLEPLDRVRELGDASVPFRFDVHALIYSENAPLLESNLHRAFDLKRVNMINNRKEFYNVSLEEIESVAKETASEIEFIRLPEAREYRETKALLNKTQEQVERQSKYNFPDTLLN
ncbi:MAG: DUF4041 domain-containing protein [Melioribacteraceae bacterium]